MTREFVGKGNWTKSGESCLAILFSLCLTVGCFAQAAKSGLVWAFVGLGFAWLTAFLIRSYILSCACKVRVSIDNDGITQSSPFGVCRIRWNDVTWVTRGGPLDSEVTVWDGHVKMLVSSRAYHNGAELRQAMIDHVPRRPLAHLNWNIFPITSAARFGSLTAVVTSVSALAKLCITYPASGWSLALPDLNKGFLALGPILVGCLALSGAIPTLKRLSVSEKGVTETWLWGYSKSVGFDSLTAITITCHAKESDPVETLELLGGFKRIRISSRDLVDYCTLRDAIVARIPETAEFHAVVPQDEPLAVSWRNNLGRPMPRVRGRGELTSPVDGSSHN